ncbi:polymer-forming cytoskeletal protein [Mucilaginibacter myungsuensis]|uniref:Polymer-forming cytoskeletal protein n=1 Tax=Mucilaginibacter myungsuensis TaxID=649104 RepID=A0A929KYK3_9SPHI|nr:polymer-forming cytoskeletal protein [Mucilaginibacter myungsuensis]MBE9660975.1 polymer-forming cytoskeletal protein [Mucilaginibacter myungsuensis]MDN3601021.1 polymer-forming cytoskeletal protein [Mucilaginibacter myungsuensis]
MLKLFKRGAEKPLIVSNIAGLASNGTEYFAQDLILLNEPLNGTLYGAGQILIEVDGKLTGNVTGKVCIISGAVKGNIVATEQLLIRNTAIITGNISAPDIDIEAGAKVSGKVKIGTDIYAIVELTEKLKNNLPTDEIPQKLKIAPDAVSITGRADEQAKGQVQKNGISKPSAARSVAQDEIPPVTRKKQTVAAAAVYAGVASDETNLVPEVKKRPVSAAPTNEAEITSVVTERPAPSPLKAPAPSKSNAGEEAGEKWW